MEHQHGSRWWGTYLDARTVGLDNMAARQDADEDAQAGMACTWEPDCPASTHLPACPALLRRQPARMDETSTFDHRHLRDVAGPAYSIHDDGVPRLPDGTAPAYSRLAIQVEGDGTLHWRIEWGYEVGTGSPSDPCRTDWYRDPLHTWRSVQFVGVTMEPQ